MTHRNAPGWKQIVAACVLVIFGALGGCFVGGFAGFTVEEGNHVSGVDEWAGLVFWTGVVVGLAIGIVLAARVLRRPDG
jgi:hypothetical protein